ALLAPTSQPDPSALLPETLNAASPLRGEGSVFRRARERLEEQMRASQCNYEAAFSDDMLLGFAQRIKNGDPIDPANPDDAPVSFGQSWNFRPGGGSDIDYNVVRNY